MPTHAEKRRVPYSASEMYALIADVTAYPEFLPWCEAVRIRRRAPLPAADGAALGRAQGGAVPGPDAGAVPGAGLGSDLGSNLGSGRAQEVLEADLVVSFKVFRERFGSRVTLRPDRREIDVEYLDGPFRYLRNHWRFIEEEPGSCEIDFFVDFEFRSSVLQAVIGVVFGEAMQRIVRAFEARAEALYGQRSL